MSNQCDHGHLRRVCEICQRDEEIEQLKAERDAAVKALRFLFDHGAYLTERVPDDLKAAIDAARGKT